MPPLFCVYEYGPGYRERGDLPCGLSLMFSEGSRAPASIHFLRVATSCLEIACPVGGMAPA